MVNYINFFIKKENYMYFKIYFKSNSNNNIGIVLVLD